MSFKVSFTVKSIADLNTVTGTLEGVISNLQISEAEDRGKNGRKTRVHLSDQQKEELRNDFIKMVRTQPVAETRDRLCKKYDISRMSVIRFTEDLS